MYDGMQNNNNRETKSTERKEETNRAVLAEGKAASGSYEMESKG